MQELGCKPNERAGIKTLLVIAGHYFPEAMHGGVFSQRFINFIRDQHIEMGYDAYVKTTTGGLRQMQQGGH